MVLQVIRAQSTARRLQLAKQLFISQAGVTAWTCHIFAHRVIGFNLTSFYGQHLSMNMPTWWSPQQAQSQTCQASLASSNARAQLLPNTQWRWWTFVRIVRRWSSRSFGHRARPGDSNWPSSSSLPRHSLNKSYFRTQGYWFQFGVILRTTFKNKYANLWVAFYCCWATSALGDATTSMDVLNICVYCKEHGPETPNGQAALSQPDRNDSLIKSYFEALSGTGVNLLNGILLLSNCRGVFTCHLKKKRGRMPGLFWH